MVLFKKTALLMSAILNHPLRTALPFVRIICAISLSFLGGASIMTRQFFSRPLTRSLPPRASADPDRRLNNP
ncbi:hypothetical protein ACWKYK_22180, partial [Enterobacter hormaechei]